VSLAHHTPSVLFIDPWNRYHEMIVVSTIENTQIFRIDNQHTFSAEPSSAQGFSTNERTICAGNLAQKLADGKYPCQYVAQVTATGVYLVKYNETLRQYDREDGWDAQERLGPNSKIAVASINNSQVLLALGGGRIVVLNVANGKLNTSVFMFQILRCSSAHSAETGSSIFWTVDCKGRPSRPPSCQPKFLLSQAIRLPRMPTLPNILR